ncbi:MAG: 50S ribosomal protein L1 [Rickettsiaceae bacterium]|nr:50S ribosomal protein L1 [Rickettsiaceae bacterium]MDP4832595.1 50S ribosomal protein L1 [Rickettsiaceae bacterium]MDP5021166.1 50S ribosomal protein L1 [Rickettsiaceae bacterium]MDP5083389.1 50S ribosomal protein L1 [Rickettsiaceae bacterium]
MGKKIAAIKKELDRSKEYSLQEAISLIKKNSFVKFDETLDVVIKLGVDPKHSDQMVRGMVSLPAGTGKDVKVAVICKDDKVAEATAAGADIAGSESIIEDIKAGKINFDVCIATPDMMGVVGQVARVLGPKGLMPNPKLGTVTADIATAVKNAKGGQVEYRVEKAGLIHAGVGKISFKEVDLLTNTKVFVDSVVKAKPAAAKGTYLKGVYLSSTMGPSLKVDLSTIAN